MLALHGLSILIHPYLKYIMTILALVVIFEFFPIRTNLSSIVSVILSIIIWTSDLFNLLLSYNWNWRIISSIYLTRTSHLSSYKRIRILYPPTFHNTFSLNQLPHYLYIHHHESYFIFLPSFKFLRVWYLDFRISFYKSSLSCLYVLGLHFT